MNFLKKNIQNPRIKLYANCDMPNHVIAPPEINKLIKACESDNIQQVKHLIKNGLDPNFVLSGEYYLSPLLQALTLADLNENCMVANYLLNLPNIEVNIYGHYKFGTTPLILATEIEAVPCRILKKILKKGADTNHHCEDGLYDYTPEYQTALIICSIEGYYKKAKLLIDYNANPNLACTYGYTPLMYAAENNHLNIVELLLDAGSNINHRANDGMTALLLAAQKQNKAIVNLLLKADAKLI